MADQIHDSTVSGTAKDNIPTQSNPMDNIHGTTEDISNKASGYKVRNGGFFQSVFGKSDYTSADVAAAAAKATISNPNTKESTKEKAKEMLEKLGGEDAFMKNNKKGE